MILAIETSTREASLAIYDREADIVIALEKFVSDRAHNAMIFAPLQELVETYRDQLRGVVVGLGPGSYGGVRVGIAVANGLSIALQIPTAGGSSLEAWDVDDDSYLVVSDARRGSFSVAIVRDRILLGTPALVDEADTAAYLAPFLAEGLSAYTPDAKVAERLGNVTLSYPSAMRLALRFREVDFAAATKIPLEPAYLRAPYITEAKKRG